jgi:hypothetical protein
MYTSNKSRRRAALVPTGVFKPFRLLLRKDFSPPGMVKGLATLSPEFLIKIRRAYLLGLIDRNNQMNQHDAALG